MAVSSATSPIEQTWNNVQYYLESMTAPITATCMKVMTFALPHFAAMILNIVTMLASAWERLQTAFREHKNLQRVQHLEKQLYHLVREKRTLEQQRLALTERGRELEQQFKDKSLECLKLPLDVNFSWEAVQSDLQRLIPKEQMSAEAALKMETSQRTILQRIQAIGNEMRRIGPDHPNFEPLRTLYCSLSFYIPQMEAMDKTLSLHEVQLVRESSKTKRNLQACQIELAALAMLAQQWQQIEVHV